MFRFGLLFILLLFSMRCLAQRDSSLTKDFAKLSAKERARIAAREDVDAAADTAFQARMGIAEQRFQQGEFQAALDLYRSARAMRPYNVHPKVKIQDLEALVARQQAEVMVPVPKEVVEEGQLPPAMVGTVQMLEAPEVRPEPPAAPSIPTPMIQVQPKVITASAPVPVPPKVEHPAVPSVDGTQERTFKEGRAVVLERQVVRDGHPTVWRMVTHPWGEVVYFKDGDPISSRVWKDQFGEQ